ncbi:MAG TPA: P-loop NTPase [Polyangia bacterium]|jgi:flagellar biosynthesis protein FlhG
MDDFARPRFDPSSAHVARARSLRNVTMLKTGRWHTPLGARQGARFIAVTGRSAVGKSTVTANLAIALAGLRARVVLIDLDVRRPTQHRLFGITSPVSGLRALLEAQIDTMEQALTPTAVRNLFLVSAEGARPPELPARPEQQHRLLQQIWELDADIVIADVPAGTDDELVDLFALGALRIVVASPNSRSVRSVYNYFRAEVIREIDHVAGGTTGAAALVSALTEPTPRAMKDLLTTLGDRPDLRSVLMQSLDGFGARLIGNRAHDSNEADLLHAASRMLSDYLGISVPVLGVLEAHEHVGARPGSLTPLLMGNGIDRNVRTLHAMAELLLIDVNEAEAPHCVSDARPRIIEPRCCLPGRPARDDDGDGLPLPVPLGTYMRRFPRYPVDWHARYVSDAGRDMDVRVFEVSQGGASIEAIPHFDLGEKGLLTFTQLEGQPQLTVTIMDARRPMGRAGLRFEGTAALALHVSELARVVAAAAAPPSDGAALDD